MGSRLRRSLIAISILLVLSGVLTISVLFYYNRLHPVTLLRQDLPFNQHAQPTLKSSIKIPRVLSSHDQDGDGIDDLDDIVLGARAEANRRPSYRSAYYKGGYPPETEGVCTDVIWRSFRDAGYDLKALVDRDVVANVKSYPRVGGKPDPNIDFRRVPNLVSFFSRHAMKLPIEVRPRDAKNLELWQGGDIVVFGKPYPHIGIISDKRRSDGVPLLIHNGGPNATEADYLLDWPSPITHHFRFTGQANN